MQRVTNCILKHQNHILLLQKPSKGWYAMPGGKMEQGENIKESVIREFKEETGLYLMEPKLRGVFTMVKKEQYSLEKEWMMYTFFCDCFEGELLEQSKEGKLKWIPVEEVSNLPTAPSDKFIHQHLLHRQAILYGTFEYGADYQLTDYRFN
ncbi:8-oxo-dGTP diphosphatase [Paraliobacillus sp. PM-2]|uniref:8-oxo-dGTP diphosphatase n=1 Tax=Paraliobacillus sp. PM-2 TaxID=1462524 RepID=UPI00061BDAF1|nr:8-oxo-dGTP diphosphatase [Paraliobacillus sp. PM-2]CQR46481.1 8-oxo-dGTP diphosphatase [Paraliobacillus sp. PM-2]